MAMRPPFPVACAVVAALLACAIFPALAQDVRGLEICTAEKNMERRTGCLQANIEFLQQRLSRMTLEAQQKQAAAEREIAALRKDVAALSDMIAQLREKAEKAEKAKNEK
jgi:septal ring factor EnvC (AmiA/AmiB activator)